MKCATSVMTELMPEVKSDTAHMSRIVLINNTNILSTKSLSPNSFPHVPKRHSYSLYIDPIASLYYNAKCSETDVLYAYSNNKHITRTSRW